MAKKSRVLNFFKEVKSELKKVVWPSFKQVKNNTLIVIACVLVIGAFIWVFDAAFGFGWGKIVGEETPAVGQTTDMNAVTDTTTPQQ